MNNNKQRYTCDCDPDMTQELKDTYVFSRQTVINLPAWSKARKARLKWVSVDPGDYIAMHELGYEQSPVTISDQGYAMGVYTFFL